MRLKYVVRRLMQAPAFTLITAVTLALGIGANSAIFSVIEGVLLKPLAYPHPEELIALNHAAPGINFPDAGSASFLYFTYREEGRSFADSGVWAGDSVSVTGVAEPEQVDAIGVTSEVLPALGVAPALGRWFSAQDDAPGSPKTMVLMNGYWRARFGGDRSVIGRRVMVDGDAVEVIGVMPEGFRFLSEHPSLIVPLQFDRNKTFLGNFSYQGIARLKPGVTIAQASADVARMIPLALDKFPAFPGYDKQMFVKARLGPNLKPLRESVVGNVGKVLWVLMGTLGLVLLIACANVANLLLVRAEGREQELAIRAALGAGWAQIARELLAESVALGILGGAIGLGLAYAALRPLVSMAQVPRLDEISIDVPVLLFTLAVSLIAGLIFGMIPVMKYAGRQVAGALRGGGRTLSASRERHRARNTLAMVQIALALVLLIGSGLLIRTFQAMRHVDPGFTRPKEVQTFRISIPETQVQDAGAAIHMEQDILDRISQIPGVASAGISTMLPMDGGGWRDAIWAEDRPLPQGQIPPIRRFKFVSPGFIETMGNRLVTGRDFTWTDAYQRRPVAMVSENMARELWGDARNAIGKRIRESLKTPWREVVGVVSDEREDGVDQKAPEIAFWPLLTEDFEGAHESVRRAVTYAVRSPRTGTRGFVAEIQKAVWSANANVPVAEVRTLQDLYEKSMARTSFTLVMLAIAGGMALLIGLVGIYGVISYSVSQRRREIGIRMALGAASHEVTGMFVRQALTLAIIGAACGLIAAAGMTRLLSSLLFGVSAMDPATFIAIAAGLIVAALAASYFPALRATKVDPVEALRAE